MMEVRGVFMSWETLVTSSLRKRSLRIRSSTALVMPPRMLFMSSPCAFSSPIILEVSTLAFMSPFATARAAFLSFTAHQRRYAAAAASMSFSTNHRNVSVPGL